MNEQTNNLWERLAVSAEMQHSLDPTTENAQSKEFLRSMTEHCRGRMIAMQNPQEFIDPEETVNMCHPPHYIDVC
jgi:hypothetical protein